MNKTSNKRLRAFTLVEISVTMLLSLIVIAMMYMALHIVARQIEQPEDKKLENIALLKTAINHAFFEASTITFSEEEQIITCRDSSMVRRFVMSSRMIVIQLPDAVSDTIWQGDYWYRTESADNMLVDRVNFWFPVQADTLEMQISKQYSPATLLNHKKISFEY